jgi:ribose transport system substrate-binding protein
MEVNEGQLELGRMNGCFLREQLGNKTDGKIFEVRGLPGNSVDRDRHIGFREVAERLGWSISQRARAAHLQFVEVVGNWDDGTAQKGNSRRDRGARHFDAVFVHEMVCETFCGT